MKKNVYVRAFNHKSKRPITRRDAEKALLNIWKEYERRRGGSWHKEPFTWTKNESARYFLRREVYALGTYIRNVPPNGWSTRKLVESVRPSLNRPDSTGDTFHDLLMSVFETDHVLSRAERWEATQELEYAWRHNVPPELLSGFLLQSGPKSELSQKLKSGYIEPAFRIDEDDDTEDDE